MLEEGTLDAIITTVDELRGAGVAVTVGALKGFLLDCLHASNASGPCRRVKVMHANAHVTHECARIVSIDVYSHVQGRAFVTQARWLDVTTLLRQALVEGIFDELFPAPSASPRPVGRLFPLAFPIFWFCMVRCL